MSNFTFSSRLTPELSVSPVPVVNLSGGITPMGGYSSDSDIAEARFIDSEGPLGSDPEEGILAGVATSKATRLSDGDLYSFDNIPSLAVNQGPPKHPAAAPSRKPYRMMAEAELEYSYVMAPVPKTIPRPPAQTERSYHWDRPHPSSSFSLGDETQRSAQAAKQFQKDQLQSTAQDKRGMPPSRRPPLIPLMEINEVPIGGVTQRSDWYKYHDLIYDLDNLPDWANPNDPPRRHTFGDSIAVHRVLGLDEEADVRRVNSPICLHYARDGFFSRRTMLSGEPPPERKREMMKRMAEEYAATHGGRVLTERMMKDFDDSLIDLHRRQHIAKCRERLARAARTRNVRSASSNKQRHGGNPLVPGSHADDDSLGQACRCTTQ